MNMSWKVKHFGYFCCRLWQADAQRFEKKIERKQIRKAEALASELNLQSSKKKSGPKPALIYLTN